MSTGLVKAIKIAAMDAVENAQMTDLRYGVVTDIDPLTVRVSSQFILPKEMLVVPQHLTDYTVPVAMSDIGGSDETNSELKYLTVYNSLNLGDRVALLRKKGGQSYFILDRL